MWCERSCLVSIPFNCFWITPPIANFTIIPLEINHESPWCDDHWYFSKHVGSLVLRINSLVTSMQCLEYVSTIACNSIHCAFVSSYLVWVYPFNRFPDILFSMPLPQRLDYFFEFTWKSVKPQCNWAWISDTVLPGCLWKKMFSADHKFLQTSKKCHPIQGWFLRFRCQQPSSMIPH